MWLPDAVELVHTCGGMLCTHWLLVRTICLQVYYPLTNSYSPAFYLGALPQPLLACLPARLHAPSRAKRGSQFVARPLPARGVLFVGRRSLAWRNAPTSPTACPPAHPPLPFHSAEGTCLMSNNSINVCRVRGAPLLCLGLTCRKAAAGNSGHLGSRAVGPTLRPISQS